MCRSSLADQEFNNIQVVVMDGHMKGCQTVLLNTHTYKYIETHKNIRTYETNKLNHLYTARWPCEEHKASHLPCCIGVGSPLQEELSHIHLPILGGYVKGGEAFLLQAETHVP